MSSQDWEVNWNTEDWMKTHYPGLLRKEDDDVWERWARHVGCRPAAAKILVKAVDVRLPLKARAVLARVIPNQYLPFFWGEESEGYWDMSELHGYSSVPGILRRLRFDSLCSFMESLPASTLFDLSGHPAVNCLEGLNKKLSGYLALQAEDGKLFLDQERALEAYRCSSLVMDYNSCGEHFSAFYSLLRDQHISSYWKKQADLNMRAMVMQDLAGDPVCAGSLAGYVNTVRKWINCPDEGPKPYPWEICFSQMEFLLGIDCAWDRRLPIDLLGNVGYVWQFSLAKRADVLDQLGRHFLIEQPLSDQFRPIRHSLAKALVNLSQDEQLLAIANRVVEVENELERPERERRAAEEAALEAEKEAREQEGQRLLEEMK